MKKVLMENEKEGVGIVICKLFVVYSVLPKAHIFIGWRIKNPLNGPVGASVFSLNQ